MSNVKVLQKSNNFPERPNYVGEKNMFDLSHDVKTTFTMGKLVPTLVLETLPGDDFYIRAEIMCRFAPLYLPIMHRVNVAYDFFYIPNRVVWPRTLISLDGLEEMDGWEYFIMGQSGGSTPLIPPYAEVQPFDYTSGVWQYTYELPQYMGFPTKLDGALVGALGTFQVNAIPLSAYYAVWDLYYRNDQVQDRIWTQLTSGVNVLPNPGNVAANYLTCRYRNWNRDQFTSATPLPQTGGAVQIPLVSISAETAAGLALHGPTQWRKIADDTNPGLQSPFKTSADGETLLGVGNIPVYLDIQETAGTIQELRYNLMLQEFLERQMRAGDEYPDQMTAFWNENPFKGVIQRPQWIGSKKGKVVISEVMSTAETSTLKVGNYAGQALVLESTESTITVECQEHGFILGIISVYPDSSYMQGLEKFWTRTSYLDYAWPQFALIGDEEVKNKEVNMDLRATGVQPDPDYNDSVFGYVPKDSSYRYKNDMYTGLMRTTFISFHLGRILSIANPQLTVLDSNFLECRPDVTRVFQVAENEDEIYAHIYNDIKVNRRLPKYAVPSI